MNEKKSRRTYTPCILRSGEKRKKGKEGKLRFNENNERLASTGEPE